MLAKGENTKFKYLILNNVWSNCLTYIRSSL